MCLCMFLCVVKGWFDGYPLPSMRGQPAWEGELGCADDRHYGGDMMEVVPAASRCL